MQTFFIFESEWAGSPPAAHRANAAALACLLLCAASCGAPASEGQPAPAEPAPVIRWSAAAPLPVAKGGHTSGIVGAQLVIAGGTYWEQDRKVYADSVEGYDPALDGWTAWPSLPHPVGYAAGASFEERLYIAGGSDGVSGRANVYMLQKDPGASPSDWVELQPLPQPRVYAAGVVIAGRFFVAGGASRGDDLSSVSNELLSLPLGGSSGWVNHKPLPGSGRALHAAASCAGAVYVFGGCLSDSHGVVEDLRDAYVYRPDQDHWERIRDLPWPVRAQSATCYQDRLVLLAGGFSGNGSPEPEGFRRDVIAYDTASDSYAPLSRLPQSMMDSEAQVHRDKLFVAGGEDRARGRSKRLMVGALADIKGWLRTRRGSR